MAHICTVLPSWNGAATLERAIDCYLSQDHADKSLIIVDSKSDDGSHDIIARYADRPDVTWLQEPERGLSHCNNMAVKIMPEDAIFGWLGTDDFMEPGILSIVSDHFDTHPEAIGLFFDSYTAREGREPVYRACPADTYELKNLLKFRSVAGLQNTYLRMDVAKAYPFSENIKYAMDYELFLRLADAGFGARITRCAKASTINTSDGNLSRRFKRASKRESLLYALHYAPAGWPKLRAWLKFLKYRWV